MTPVSGDGAGPVSQSANRTPQTNRAQSRLRPVAAAGLLLVGSLITVNYALTHAGDSRRQAGNLTVVAAKAEALATTRDLVDSTGNAALFRRAASIGAADFIALRRALSELPDDAAIGTLRTDASALVPVLAQILAAIEDDDLVRARQVGQGQLQPRLAALRERSSELAGQQLESADRAEAVARIGSGLTLVGGSLGLGLLALGVARTRQRSELDRTRREIEARSSTRLDALVSHATDAVVVVDDNGRITWISNTPAFPLPMVPQKAIGGFFTDLIYPADRKRAAQAFADLLAEAGSVFTMQLRMATDEGQARPVEIRGENRLGDDAIDGVVLTLHDVSERTLLEDQLERLASRDPITGVANRAEMEAHLQATISRRSERGRLVALMLADLDDFRAVSDTLGHDAGDELLRHAARRLDRAAGNRDLVARLDGATFAVLLDDLESVGEGQARATKIADALRGKTSITGGHAIDLSPHVGLAFGAPELGARQLIRHADIALLEARGAGDGAVVSFTDQMRNRVTERVALTADLRRATEQDEFEVDYQPIVDIATGQTVGVEALARWTHPHRGRLSPANFVDLAEQTGLIRPLGELILRESCNAIAALLERDPGAVEYVSVNVSPRQLEAQDLPAIVESALADSGLAPERLMLELTERSIAVDAERVIERLVGLRELGIRIALDDFGAGYSFMSFLEDYPLDALKIDRSLAKSIGERTDAALLLRGIVELSHINGMKVIVEGIETEPQRARAEELGIGLAQGFLFARPAALERLGFG